MASYTLLYCAEINDEKHKDMLKVGETTFNATQELENYTPNHEVLAKAAKDRIKGWSGTAAAGAKLVYSEALIRYNPDTKNKESFGDKVVHRVLNNAGFPKQTFDEANDSGKEWFKVNIETVKAAIKAAKEYRDYLDSSEVPEQEIYDLRQEQKAAVEQTIPRFINHDKKKHKMLWDCKMRFGKTTTALNLVKRLEYKRTIIITHRPVVEDSWGSDFYHVFSNKDNYAFITKISQTDVAYDVESTDKSIDEANDKRLKYLNDNNINFVYFASIQDLVGSKIVGGKYVKNKSVFDIKWDLVIIDEAHEGIRTTKAEKVLKKLIKEGYTKKLDLSGTAYNLLQEYMDEGSVYVWDYIKEQTMKRDWPLMHPGEPNPYEDMPTMNFMILDLKKAINGIDFEGRAFSFAEFFRTWTSDLEKDKCEIPNGKNIGDFVYEEQINQFLDALSDNKSGNQYPYSSEALCMQNAHSLWMVPGVKEAFALSKLLKKHKFFGQKKENGDSVFGVANVAGEGDEEKEYSDALKLVRKTIEKYDYSITLSCGRLTTGVTVKEWTAVMMLSGSEQSDAKRYMQTVFRAQSAGKINGKRKTDAYVYDFAPDRTLVVIHEAMNPGGGTGTECNKRVERFLELAPVLSMDGGKATRFDVDRLIEQINRVQNEAIVMSGFTDRALYNESIINEMEFDNKSLSEFDKIFNKLGDPINHPKKTSAGAGKNNVPSGGTGGGGTGGGPSPKKKKDLIESIYQRLNNIAIRIPLLFYAGDFDADSLNIEDLVKDNIIDDISWATFMPNKFTKKDFLKISKFFNADRFKGAGKKYREDLRRAEELTPTGRIKAIANIFDYFKNPAKETVLTPWRVVNMHLASTLGGYCFYNEKFEDNDDLYFNRLLNPRKVIVDEVSDKTLLNPDAQILEINSKSGLYPLYVAYSIYMSKLGEREESSLSKEELLKLWDEAVSQIYVLCQTEMAAKITERTLIGFRKDVKHNIKYDVKLLEELKKSPEKIAKKIKQGKYWNKECNEMKFDAVVGNPPYQEMASGDANGSDPVYHFFIDASGVIGERATLIHPARFLFNAGKTPKDWNKKILNNEHFKMIHYWPNSADVFPTVDIKGGVAVTLQDKMQNFGKIGIFIAHPELNAILGKVKVKDFTSFADLVYPRDLYRLTERLYEENSWAENRQSTGHRYDVGSNVFNIFPDLFFEEMPNDGYEYAKIYGRENNERIEKWIKKDYLKIPDNFYFYKIFIPKSNGSGAIGEVLSTPIVGEPIVGSTTTFLSVGKFDTETEAVACLKYIKTKFCRAMLGTLKVTQDNPKPTWANVPLQDFTSNSDIDWSKSIPEIDQQLYKKYNLSQGEIDFIESKVKPME